MSIFSNCPVLESARFQLRLIDPSDSWDLLECYSDKNSAKLFNSDNCSSDFYITNIKDMESAIKIWLECYTRKEFVRFSIVDFFTGKIIGTIEIFGKNLDNKNTGILRLDIKSEYEKEQYINDLMHLITVEFKTLFNLDAIVTKSIPEAKERIKVLREHDFVETNIIPMPHYFIKYF